MRNYLLILIVIFSCASNLKAQEINNSTIEKGDSTKSISIEYIRPELKAWSIDFKENKSAPALLDTGLLNFHMYNPLSKKHFSSTNLGYLGAPYISNDYFGRTSNSDNYFLDVFDAYRITQSEVKYYNTTTPFSYLRYDQGDQPSSKYEQIFKAFFTQNIDSVSNLGFIFSTLKNQGQYNFQESKHRFLNFFISRNSEKYNGYLSIITGSDEIKENGGIKDSIVNTNYDPFVLSVRMDNSIGTIVKSFSFFTSHEYLLGKGSSKLSSSDSIYDNGFSPLYGIQYSAKIDNHKRLLSEPSSNPSFFDTIYFDSNKSRTDSSQFLIINQILQIRTLKNDNSKFDFGKRIFVENEIVKAAHPVFLGKREYSYSNIKIGGELHSFESKTFKWSIFSKLDLLGRNFGDALLKCEVEKPLVFKNDTVTFLIEGWYQSKSANIFQEHWHDNHFKWEKTFQKQQQLVFKGSVVFPDWKMNTGIYYALLGNFIYNDIYSIPAQQVQPFSVYNYWLNKDFKIGPILWSNKLIVQGTTNPNIIHLPLLNYYTALSLNGTLFKVMKYQIGAEMYYNTKFYADKYEPSTSRFYLQNEIMTGDYPMVNLFANAKLKRTSAFAMLYHANSSFMRGNFFSSPNYPLNQMAFRFGFLWTFYD